MAIKKTLTRAETETKQALAEAYIRVVDVSVRASNNEVRIDVATYADAEARADAEASSVNKVTERATLADLAPFMDGKKFDAAGLKAAAYEWLKATMSKYQGGEDA